MDNIPTAEVVQVMDDDSSQVTTDCLSNPVIVTKIFQCFSMCELLELSCVNKLWNYEARRVMRTQRNVMARLVCKRTCPLQQVLEDFGADLKQMNVAPFSGLNIVINPKIYAVGPEGLYSTCQVILARLALTHFSLQLEGDWWDCKDCPVLLLIKHLLQGYSGVLEELTLNIEEKQEEFIEHFVQDCVFPALKVVKLQEQNYTLRDSYTNYMRALVARAPKLQELHTEGDISLMENIVEGSEALLMPLQEVSIPLDGISEGLMDKLRLKVVELSYSGPEFNLEEFNRMVPMLLHSSCGAALPAMSVDVMLAVLLMGYGISLENINDLWMAINYNLYELDQPNLLRIVKDLDFTRIFPNVKKVGICCPSFFFEFEPMPDHVDAIIEQAVAVLRRPSPDRAANINELFLRKSSISTSLVQFCAEMLPAVEKLEILEDNEGDIPFGSIWEHWSDLKEIKVTGQMVSNTGNLDSVFCGIFPEEVAELRQKDHDYLKSVHIVPAMPAITCLKNLNTLTLSINKRSREPFLDDGTFMFSEVTELIAFARFPSLVVNLDVSTHGVPPVSHLRTFASVKCCNLSANFMDKYAPLDEDVLEQARICFGENFGFD